MSDQKVLALMRSAWARRRASLDVAPKERRVALERVKKDLASAAAEFRNQGPPVSYAQALHLLAHVELDCGRDHRAQQLWEEAVGVLRTTGEALQLAHKVRHLGDLHRHCGRLDQAESSYSEALVLYRAHDEPGSLDFANAVSRMADLKEKQGEKSAALALWRETRDLYTAVGLTTGVAHAKRHIEQLR